MGLRVRKHQPGQPDYDHIQRQAVWDFVATVADWRCSICFKQIEYADVETFGRTRLCPTCSGAVNEDARWPDLN